MDAKPLAELEREVMMRRVITKIVLEMATGKVLERESLEYDGPWALCDRAATAAAGGAQQYLGNQMQTIGNYLTPQLMRWAGGAAPGYGAGGVNEMTAAAQTAAASATNQANQRGLLRSLRTGNAAGVAAGDVDAAVRSGQTQTQAVEDVLAQNAQLKAQQQMGALNMLGSLYGTDVSGQASEIKNMIDASKTGWFQNMLGLGGLGMNALTNYAKIAGV